jgi:hypothetical protein
MRQTATPGSRALQSAQRHAPLGLFLSRTRQRVHEWPRGAHPWGEVRGVQYQTRAQWGRDDYGSPATRRPPTALRSAAKVHSATGIIRVTSMQEGQISGEPNPVRPRAPQTRGNARNCIP